MSIRIVVTDGEGADVGPRGCDSDGRDGERERWRRFEWGRRRERDGVEGAACLATRKWRCRERDRRAACVAGVLELRQGHAKLQQSCQALTCQASGVCGGSCVRDMSTRHRCRRRDMRAALPRRRRRAAAKRALAGEAQQREGVRGSEGSFEAGAGEAACRPVPAVPLHDLPPSHLPPCDTCPPVTPAPLAPAPLTPSRLPWGLGGAAAAGCVCVGRCCGCLCRCRPAVTACSPTHWREHIQPP